MIFSSSYVRGGSSAASSHATTANCRHAQQLRDFNEDIFKKNMLTDVELVVDGKVFKSHRSVLVCFSPYLKKKLLTVDGKPFTSKIYIPKVNRDDFEVLLNYMYTGEINVKCTNFYEVYNAASLLEMKQVMDDCLQFLESRDEVRSYFYTYVTARKLGDESKRFRSLLLITHRFEEAIVTSEFLQLDVSCVTEVLSAQSIGARSEVIVFLAALKWLHHDYSSRKEHEVAVMECVRFSSMSMDEIMACYHPPYLQQILRNPQIMTLIFRANCYISAKFLGQESWFKNFSHPKRNLAFENLSFELWHQNPSTSTPNIDIARAWKESMKADTQDNKLKQSKQFGESQFQNKYSKSKRESAGRESQPEAEDKDHGPLATVITDAVQNVLKQCSQKSPQVDVSEVVNKVIGDVTKEQNLLESVPSHQTLPFRIRGDDEEDEDDTQDQRPVRDFPFPRRSSAGQKQGNKSDDDEGQTTPKYSRTPKSRSPAKNNFPQFLSTGRDKPSSSSPQDQSASESEGDEDTHRRVRVDYHDPVKLEGEPRYSSSILLTPEQSPGKVKKDRPSILVIGGMNPKSLHTLGIGCAILNFDLKKNKWFRYNTLPSPRHNHCSALCEGSLYVIGGCDPHLTLEQKRYVGLSSCYKLDIQTQQWTTLPDMKYKRYDHGLAVYGGQIYVIGGQGDGLSLHKTLEAYDLKRNKWKTLPTEMCCGRKAMGVTTHGNSIWIAGGLIQPEKEANYQVVSNVDCYQPREKRWWLNMNFLPSPRCYCSITAWNNFICCVGGMVPDQRNALTPTDELWFFNPESKLWEKGEDLPIARTGCAALVYNNSLYVVGGYNPEADKAVRNVNYLSSGAISWGIAAPLPSDLFGLSAVSGDYY